jgi:predicted Zn-dependent peptidase
MLRPRPYFLACAIALIACRSNPSSLEFADRSPTPPATPVEESAKTSGDLRSAIFAASDLPIEAPTPRKDDAARVSTHRLSNGMTVFIAPNQQSPRVAAWIAVRTGSRNDPANSTGLAHYLEHMLFKGTDELGTLDYAAERPHLDKIAKLYRDLRKTDDPALRTEIFANIDRETQECAKYAVPNELDHLYSALGIQGVNAFTSVDQTVYIADIPSNRLDAWAKTEAERFRDPEFRLFYTELEAVYEEKNRGMDRPGNRLWEALNKAVFAGHPYGEQTTIGEIEHLKIPAFGDMVAYFRRWYVPNNMAIVLAGDVDPQVAIPLLERSFGSWQPRALKPVDPVFPKAISGRTYSEIVAPGEESVTLAWRTVPQRHRDALALDVLDRLLLDGSSGLLAEDVLLSQKLPDASSGTQNYAESGLFYLSGTAREGQTHAQVETLLSETLAKLVTGAFSDESFAAAKLNLEIDLKGEIESNEGRANLITDAYVAREPWSEVASRLTRLRELDRKEVLRVAQTYLGKNFVALHRKRGEFAAPHIDKPKITPLPIDPTRHTPFYQHILAMPQAPIEPHWIEQGADYEQKKIASGKLLTTANTRNDLFSLSFLVDIGVNDDALLCHALDLAALAGAGNDDAITFQRKLYQLGARLSHQCGSDRVRISVTGIDRNLEASVALVQSWLEEPKFAADAAVELARNAVSLRRDQLDRPEFLSHALFSLASRGKNSDVLRLPSNATLQKAKLSTLRNTFAKVGSSQNTVLYYGPRTHENVASTLTLARAKRATKPIAAKKWQTERVPTVYLLHLPISQAQIRVFFPHQALRVEERALATLANEYLGGGMGSIVFQELREARGLAYSAHAMTLPGARVHDESGLVASIGTQVDKAPEAIAVMLEVLRRPISAERLEVAKQALEEGFRSERIEARDLGLTVLGWEEAGESGDPRPRYREAIANATPEMIQTFLAKLVKSPVIITILGDKNRLDRKAVAAFGAIKEVEIADVVPYGFPNRQAQSTQSSRAK